MNFPKANSFALPVVQAKIMGPNPLKLCEELLDGAQQQGGLRQGACPPRGAVVCDLGKGTGITSVMLVREYGFDVHAVDLWSNPEENCAFFRDMGLSNESIHPVKADASQGLPFPPDFFDAVVSVDSYNYYGRDPRYLGEKLLPYVKEGGTLHLAIPGMLHDCHDCLPDCLLLSWTPEQLEYMHDMTWWLAMLAQTPNIDIEDMHLMECTEEAWADWVACDNPYAEGDRAAVAAGALDYLATIAVRLRKK